MINGFLNIEVLTIFFLTSDVPVYDLLVLLRTDVPDMLAPPPPCEASLLVTGRMIVSL